MLAGASKAEFGVSITMVSTSPWRFPSPFCAVLQIQGIVHLVELTSGRKRSSFLFHGSRSSNKLRPLSSDLDSAIAKGQGD